MKLRYLLPFYALLIAVSFCCRKISNEKEEAAKQNEKKVAMAMSTTQPITGTLELDAAKGIIYADLYINVPGEDFKFAENFMALQTGDGYKGISFRYYDPVHMTKDKGDGIVPLHVEFNFKNDHKWVENDSIRIMSLNEDQEADYIALQPYFESRMDYFKNSVTTYSALLLFNDEWNAKHPDNTVATEEQTNTKHFLPRITRDDSILSLKLKK